MATPTIYALGDATFLATVLRGVALVFNYSGYSTLIAIGLILGVLFTAIGYISDDKFPLQKVFISLFIYLALFVPKVQTVFVEDIYNGQVHQVPDVPVGIAFGGQLVSAVGKGITEIFEQAFTPVGSSYQGIIDDGFLDPLRILLAIRQVNFPSNTQEARYFSHNMTEYLAKCSMPAAHKGDIEVDEAKRNPSLFQKLISPQVADGIMYKNASTGSSDWMNCADAGQELDSYINSSSTKDMVYKALGEQLNVRADQTQPVSSSYVENALGSWTSQLMDATGVDGYQFVMNQILLRYLDLGADSYMVRKGDMAYSYAIETARARRDLQHAAQGSLFFDIMKPMMAFVESFTYAVSPILAFMIMFGASGIKLAGKFLLLAGWIQLWLPVLAIIKLYVYMSINSEMSSLATSFSSTAGLASVIAANEFNQELSRWIGISGLLIGSVPVLSLMILTGGAITANAVASRLTQTATSAASATEGVLAPNPVSATAGGVKSGTHDAAHDFGTGATVRGFSSPTTSSSLSINDQFSSQRARTEKSLEANMQAATRGVMQTKGFTDTAGKLNQASRAEIESYEGSKSEAWDAAYTSAGKIMTEAGMQNNEQFQKMLASKMMATGAVGIPSKLLGGALKAFIGGTVEEAKSNTELAGYMNKHAGSASEQEALTEKLSSAYNDKYAYSEQAQQVQSWGRQQTFNNSETASNVEQARAEYMQAQEKSQNYTQSIGENSSFPKGFLGPAAGRWARDNGVYSPNENENISNMLDYMKTSAAAGNNADALGVINDYIASGPGNLTQMGNFDGAISNLRAIFGASEGPITNFAPMENNVGSGLDPNQQPDLSNTVGSNPNAMAANGEVGRMAANPGEGSARARAHYNEGTGEVQASTAANQQRLLDYADYQQQLYDSNNAQSNQQAADYASKQAAVLGYLGKAGHDDILNTSIADVSNGIPMIAGAAALESLGGSETLPNGFNGDPATASGYGVREGGNLGWSSVDLSTRAGVMERAREFGVDEDVKGMAPQVESAIRDFTQNASSDPHGAREQLFSDLEGIAGQYGVDAGQLTQSVTDNLSGYDNALTAASTTSAIGQMVYEGSIQPEYLDFEPSNKQAAGTASTPSEGRAVLADVAADGFTTKSPQALEATFDNHRNDFIAAATVPGPESWVQPQSQEILGGQSPENPGEMLGQQYHGATAPPEAQQPAGSERGSDAALGVADAMREPRDPIDLTGASYENGDDPISFGPTDFSGGQQAPDEGFSLIDQSGAFDDPGNPDGQRY